MVSEDTNYSYDNDDAPPINKFLDRQIFNSEIYLVLFKSNYFYYYYLFIHRHPIHLLLHRDHPIHLLLHHNNKLSLNNTTTTSTTSLSSPLYTCFFIKIIQYHHYH
ncbi:hypothetical protein RB653_007290 [Dictyostelium firmibasis]|uniref:Uncharacterized protein n=1 Tax=Dictyostelium firmibasis TaxID=79012 RepID=A0AAN7TNH3_9MYCE